MTDAHTSKPFYKTKWGIIVAILFWPFFIIWYAWDESKWSKNTKIAVTVVTALVVLPFMVAAMQAPEPTKKAEPAKTQAEAKPVEKKEEPKADTSDLKLTARQTEQGVIFSSTESTVLKNCKIDVNGGTFRDGYVTRADIMPGQETTVYWSQLSKNGERFNIYTMKPEKVMVNLCDGQGARFVSFGS